MILHLIFTVIEIENAEYGDDTSYDKTLGLIYVDDVKELGNARKQIAEHFGVDENNLGWRPIDVMTIETEPVVRPLKI